MAVILITGSGGQLGNELQKVSKGFYGYDFIFSDLPSLDITNASDVDSFVKESKPDWIINCAAWNFVDRAETEPEKAFAVNEGAVKNLTKAITGTDCRFIHISTDYVFEGNVPQPRSEEDLAAPQSKYGESKLAGEKAALSHPLSMVIRTSWLYSIHGHNFMKSIINKARETKQVSVVFDQTGTPTWAGDLAVVIMKIVSGVIRNQLSFHPGLYNYSNEGVCSWYDFATAIVNEAGIPATVDPILTSSLNLAAKRPAYSVLNKSKIKDTYEISVPYWRTSLRNCLKEL